MPGSVFTQRQVLWALAGLTAMLSLGGLVLEHGFGVLPCEMCWWQRYAHFTIFGLALVGLVVPVARLRWVFALIAACAMGGLGIACWQFAAQHGWLPFPPSCRSAGVALATGGDLLAAVQTTTIVPCDKENFRLLGLSLAGWNILAMLAVLGAAVAGINRRTNKAGD